MASDIKGQADEQLQKSLRDLREQLRVFRFEGQGSRTRNVRGGRNMRREIARILTELRTREAANKRNVASKEVNA
jgi:ribosomal protein L29